MNPLRELHQHGQSLWLDYMHRRILDNGELERQVREEGVRGGTSNPSIFQKAIAGGTTYDDALAELVARHPRSPVKELFERLAVEDIRRAADTFRTVYDESGGDDGYISLEVSPYLARDTAATLDEVRRLWREVDRPNLMIKVPATAEGIPAIEQGIAEGYNINITLMFSLDHYEAVAEAYIRGLESLEDPSALTRIASVASFFVSRVDGKVDPRLEQLGSDEARALRGKIAVDNAKMAYKRFREIFHGERFAALREKGARVQRVLYGSTSTKNPEYSDVLYVENLIGSETVNTAPPDTIEAFRDHGRVRDTLAAGWEESEARLARLAELGIDLDEVTEDLQREGVAAFAAAFDDLLAAVETKRRSILRKRVAGSEKISFAAALRPVGERLEAWQDASFGRRLWSHDRTLWSAEPVPEVLDRLGWLDLPLTMVSQIPELLRFAEEARRDTDDVVLLGMGGSSLAPDVFQRVFGNRPGYPKLTVLDSTHPQAVESLFERIDPARSLFLVSSKSGTTTETLSFFRTCWERAEAVPERGSRFLAITDPGTPLADLARERGFRRLFEAQPDLGGRYSALSHFGMVPAALVGVDVQALLERAWGASLAFGPERPALVNGALRLGAALGELALAHRDKVTFAATAGLVAFPDWLEQLIAESTGKEGRGIVPVAHEELGEPAVYGDDRLFVGFSLRGDEAGLLERRLAALERAGHPVVRIELGDELDLGREMMRWEIAVAAAGAVLGIHPFNQPDVQLAKDLARKAMDEGGEGAGRGMSVDVADAAALRRSLGEWIDAAGPGDYLAIQAYLAPTAEATDALLRLQRALRDRTGRATTLGFGPRFLHSTGQLHKGGPASGHFLQLVDRPSRDLPIPETGHSFAALIRAQAAGDRQALEQRGRPVLAVDLGSETAGGLDRLLESLAETEAEPAGVHA